MVSDCIALELELEGANLNASLGHTVSLLQGTQPLFHIQKYGYLKNSILKTLLIFFLIGFTLF